jgi:DNA gyrase subunit A
MGRATQGVRLINLTKKNDVIASVCKVMSSELEATVEEESRVQWAQKNAEIMKDSTGATNLETITSNELNEGESEEPFEDSEEEPNVE